MEHPILPEHPVVDRTTEWQRISPLAMLYFFVSFLKHIIGNFVYIAPGVVIAYKSISSNVSLFLPIAIVCVLVLLGNVVLNFYFFRFRLTDKSLYIKSGVIKKVQIHLPFPRIQHVKLEQPWYFRPFDYVCLQFDTAGSTEQEAKLIAIEHAFAKQLKDKILHAHQDILATPTAEQQDATEQNAFEQELNRRSMTDLVIHGISNNRVWIILGALIPFADNAWDKAAVYLETINIDLHQLFNVNELALWQVGVYALALFLLVLIPIAFLSIAGSILSFYGYTLCKVEDKYIRRSGLLTKHEVAMRLSRLQILVQQQDWLDVLFKRANLSFEQINANSSGSEVSSGNAIMVPSVTLSESKVLANDAMPKNQVFDINYHAISKWYLFRYLVQIYLPIAFTAVCLFIWIGKTQLLFPVIGIYALLSCLHFCRWRRFGVAMDDKYIYLRKGTIGKDYYCFERFKIQQIQFKQSWFLKRKKLAGIKFVLASGAESISFVDQELARKMVDCVLLSAESSKRSWM